jgi:hypothetical protein
MLEQHATHVLKTYAACFEEIRRIFSSGGCGRYLSFSLIRFIASRTKIATDRM